MLNLNYKKSLSLEIINFFNQNEDILKEADKEADKFANLLVTNGLIPTLVYYNTKSRKDNKIKDFYEKIIKEFLINKLKLGNKDIFHFLLKEAKPSKLLTITNLMLYFANYLKYYVKKLRIKN